MKTLFVVLVSLFSLTCFAGVEGSISGSVLDNLGVAASAAAVQLLSPSGTILKETKTGMTGDFQFFPVAFGDYQLAVKVKGFQPSLSSVHVSSGGNTPVAVNLVSEAKEMVLNVKAKRHLVQNSSSVSSAEISKDEINKLPQGETIHLPKLLATTTAGVVQGPFGQSFIRGNHANIQYQIDGVQLPDSPSNTFGEAFTPRNIDHMEVITGGVPAEYGERLAAVVNIATKSGTETPGGEVALDYGSYNSTSPFALYSGSNAAGDLHYFISAGFSRTDRGLDTPEPASEYNITQGGKDAVHDMAWGHNQFAKVDWLPDNSDKFSFILFNSYNFFQIPNLPSSFQPSDSYFQASYVDQFGNSAVNWTPSSTDDTQSETNSYFQVVWKKTLSDKSFLQIAPYYKYSYIGVKNDPANDLAAAYGPTPIVGSTPSSFTESRPVSNYGLKGDYSERISDEHLLKFGVQLQGSQASGGITVLAGQQGNAGPTTSSDNSLTTGYFESIYAQDDYTILKSLILNVGLRFDATQFSFGGNTPVYSADSLLQPRVGINYLLTETTKLHAFYGKLFQPAPAENLRDTFVQVGGGNSLAPYDIKAEKDDYYEVGISQQYEETVFILNAYYKNSISQLDDQQLLNTSIAQPFNFAQGFAYGVELSMKGRLSGHITDYFNYSYEIAKGNGLGGGLFTGITPSTDWQFLDHVQISTANAGVNYSTGPWWWTTQGLFGSGLRTGQNNVTSLPPHLTFDTSLGYEFKGETWWERFKVSGDVLNIFNNVYPITIANGFNGSHYAVGTEYFVHFIKEL